MKIVSQDIKKGQQFKYGNTLLIATEDAFTNENGKRVWINSVTVGQTIKRGCGWKQKVEAGNRVQAEFRPTTMVEIR